LELVKNATCVAFLLLIALENGSSAQDVKPLSSDLARSITASGRKTVAVVDFTDLQGNVTELGRYLAEELSVGLVREAKGFEVIERNQLRVILQEHRLSATGLIDPQTARKLGQFAGADALLTGTLTAFGDTVHLSVKVVDTESAKMLGVATTDIPKTRAIEELLDRGIGDARSSSSTGTKSSPESDSSAEKMISSVSAESGKLQFTLRACSRSRQRITCRGSVTDKWDGRIRVEFPYGARDSFLDDDQDSTYPLGAFAFGISGDGQDLDPDLPVPFVFAIEDSKQTARFVNITLTYRPIDLQRNAYMSQGGKVGFRRIPVQ
jgi:TolB-like protein